MLFVCVSKYNNSYQYSVLTVNLIVYFIFRYTACFFYVCVGLGNRHYLASFRIYNVHHNLQPRFVSEVIADYSRCELLAWKTEYTIFFYSLQGSSTCYLVITTNVVSDVLSTPDR